VQIGRNLLEFQVVFLMAVGAADLVEVLPFRLLRREWLGSATGRERECKCDGQKKTWKRT